MVRNGFISAKVLLVFALVSCGDDKRSDESGGSAATSGSAGEAGTGDQTGGAGGRAGAAGNSATGGDDSGGTGGDAGNDMGGVGGEDGGEGGVGGAGAEGGAGTSGTAGAGGANGAGAGGLSGAGGSGAGVGGRAAGGAGMSGAGGASGGLAGSGGAGSGGAGAGGASAGNGGGGVAGLGGAGGNGGMSAGNGGAGSGDPYVSNVLITVHTEVRTILVVTWTQLIAAEETFLEFTFESGNVMRSRSQPGTLGAHRDVVLGVPGSTPVTIRIVSRQGGTSYPTQDYLSVTGTVPSGFPLPTMVTHDPGLASPERWILGAVENSTGGCNSTQCYFHTTFWTYIMDRRGRIVWYYSDPASNATTSHPRIARDGEYIWLEKRPFGGSGTRGVLKRTLDGTYSENIPISNLSDCIDVTTDGSLLYDANNILRERTRAGQTRDIWNCRNYFPTGSCFTNTIQWNERDNTVLMTYPERDTVLEVSRASGQVVGQYGMEAGSYAFATAPPPPPPEATWQFGYPHFGNITKDGTLMLSSHLSATQATNQPIAGQHAFMEFSINRTSRTLTNVWYYNVGQEWAMYKGMAIKLSNDNVLLNYGTGGVIREVTPSKQTAFYAKFDAPPGTSGNDFFNKLLGLNFLVDDLYALNGGPD